MVWWLFFLLPLCSGLVVEPAPPGSRNTPTEHWLNVRLNQFMAYNTDTFPMRFFYSAESATSPHAVIVLSDVTHESPEWSRSGLAEELATAVGAGLFYTEHRYYGQSRPSGDTNLENLRYLTIDHVLADIAQLIQYIKSDHFEGGQYKEGNVVLVGCSYGGSLATWMTLAYPHLVAGAFSDCGPLEAREELPEYLEIVTSAIRSRGGDACVSTIEDGVRSLVSLLETGAVAASVSTMFNTCTTISATPLDTATFFYNIQQAFSSLVELNYDSIADACQVITAADDPVQGLANWIQAQDISQPCLETRYTETLATIGDTSYDNTHVHKRVWSYQSCVELGWFPTTGGDGHPFLSTVPLEYFRQMCRDLFSISPDEQFPLLDTARTNLMFGARDFLPDGVVSVSGALAPRAALAPLLTHTTLLAPVYQLPGVGHCAVMSGSVAESESELVREAKISVMNRLAVQLRGAPVFSAAGTTLASLTLLVAAIVFVI